MKTTKIIALLTAGMMLLSGCNNKTVKKSTTNPEDVAIKVGDIAVTNHDIAVLTDLVYSQYGEGSGAEFNTIRDEQVDAIKETLEKGAVARAIGIELTEEDKLSAIGIRASYAQQNGGYKAFEKYLKDNGSSIAALDAIFTEAVYSSKLYEKVREDEFKKFYKDNYYCAKHILVTKPAEGAEVAEGEKQGEELANELLERAKKGEDFDAMIKEYTQDPGSEEYPNGYIFTDGEMVEPFENKVKELKPGEFGICESDFGYHIILRQDLPSFEDYKKDYSTAYPPMSVEEGIEQKVADLVKEQKIKVEVKQELIDAINEATIKKSEVEATEAPVQ